MKETLGSCACDTVEPLLNGTVLSGHPFISCVTPEINISTLSSNVRNT